MFPNTLLGTNISSKNGILKMIFLFPRWDMLIPWRVHQLSHPLGFSGAALSSCLHVVGCFFFSQKHQKTQLLPSAYGEAMSAMRLDILRGFTRLKHTVDGSEIRHSPVDMVGTNPVIYKVLAPSKRWLFGISEPSTIMTSR